MMQQQHSYNTTTIKVLAHDLHPPADGDNVFIDAVSYNHHVQQGSCRHVLQQLATKNNANAETIVQNCTLLLVCGPMIQTPLTIDTFVNKARTTTMSATDLKLFGMQIVCRPILSSTILDPLSFMLENERQFFLKSHRHHHYQIRDSCRLVSFNNYCKKRLS